MAIPESLLLLAGFVFAHATWSVSDLPEGELLVPMAIVEKSGQRQLQRFEAETQVKAIMEGKAYLKDNEKNFDAWAFAREGQMLFNGKYVDTLTVEAKANGMSESIVFVQKFQPFSSGVFKLIGEPLVSIGGNQVSDDEAKSLISELNDGVETHQKAVELWPQWVEK